MEALVRAPRVWDKLAVALQGKSSLCSFAYHLVAPNMFRSSLIFHGSKEGPSLETACVEQVVCTCSG